MQSSNLKIFSPDFIKQLRKILLGSIAWIFIAAVVLGVIVIIFNSESDSSAIGRVYGTLGSMLAFVVYSFANLALMGSKNNTSKWLAAIGLITNILTVFLGILAIWEVFPMTTEVGNHCFAIRDCTKDVLTAPAVIFLIFGSVSFLSVLGSFTSTIKEDKFRNVVRPLKYTALACLVYIQIHWIVLVLNNWDLPTNWITLASFLSGIYVLAAVSAFIISNLDNKKKDKNPSAPINLTSTTQSPRTLSQNNPNFYRQDNIQDHSSDPGASPQTPQPQTPQHNFNEFQSSETIQTSASSQPTKNHPEDI